MRVTIRNGKFLQAVNVASLSGDREGDLYVDLEYQLFYVDGGVRPATSSYEGPAETVTDGARRYLVVSSPNAVHVHKMLVDAAPTPESNARVDRTLDGYLHAMLGGRMSRKQNESWIEGFRGGLVARRRLGPAVARLHAEWALEREQERRASLR
jgi:hypothetical protein